MQKITASLLGVVAVAASLLALRQPRPAPDRHAEAERLVPAGETVPAQISLDRIRELGL
ncbi:MAG TPA: hypothetical protein VK858_15245 [Longimicrobiales bacterium]|nr:hypothetical protein [Longimicrobiales bacterium]